MNQVIEQLLLFARPSEPKVHSVSAHEIVSDTLRFLRHETNAAGVEVNNSIPVDLPLLNIDENQVKQVFINIVLNAVQAMESRKGLLELFGANMERDGRQFVDLLFKDNGCGMSRERSSRIFEPFYTTKTPGGSSGLLSVRVSGQGCNQLAVIFRALCLDSREPIVAGHKFGSKLRVQSLHSLCGRFYDLLIGHAQDVSRCQGSGGHKDCPPEGESPSLEYPVIIPARHAAHESVQVPIEKDRGHSVSPGPEEDVGHMPVTCHAEGLVVFLQVGAK